MSLAGSHWNDNTQQDFDAAATNCEIVVTMSQAQHRALVDMLARDPRDGRSGRCLQRGYAPLGLLAGDRLDPAPNLLDTADFDEVAAFPYRATFWRVSRETLVHHRCPFWSPAIGLLPMLTIGIDLLHCFYLGPLQQWGKAAVWHLIDSNLWSGPEPTQEMRQLTSLSALQQELLHFYTQYDRAHKGHPLTRAPTLKPATIWIGANRRLKLKAMETWGFALFLLDILMRRQGYLGEKGRSLLRAGSLMRQLLMHLKSCPANLSVIQAQHGLDLWKQTMIMSAELEFEMPKSHMMFHMLVRAQFLGNPLRYQTFLDESLNKTMKRVLRLCHQANFERSALLKLTETLSRPSVRQRLL